MNHNMTRSEMRLCRRELINLFLQESNLQYWMPNWNVAKLAWCKEFVRGYEKNTYGYELAIYHPLIALLFLED